jgi:hypothetical protein
MEILEIKKCQKNAVFLCKNCDFKCSKKSNYINHVKTKKHIYRHNGNNLEMIFPKKNAENAEFICYCGKKYSTNSGLWKHKQKCKKDIQEEKINTIIDVSKEQLILMLVKQNSELIKETNEFKNMMMEVIKNGTHNTTHTNSHNKSFNLQFFLNETCKNAMNITDFINSLQLQLSDLENVGEVGYIEGISNIIIKNLNALDITERPIHCTDKKRETMYVKDENKWEKENEKKDKIHKMIRKISNKNINLISEFREKNPDYKKSSSKVSDQFNKIIIESMGGSGENDYEKEEKIIKKIAKEVFVDKNLQI